MTNRIAISLALLIAAFLLFDALRRDWELSLFLGRKLLALIDLVKFWR